jgi:hypothetical protein
VAFGKFLLLCVSFQKEPHVEENIEVTHCALQLKILVILSGI